MPRITPKKVLIIVIFNIDQAFLGFLSQSDNSMYELRDNGL